MAHKHKMSCMIACKLHISVIWICFSCLAFGQSGNGIMAVSAGYTEPRPDILAAPGQVVTLFVSGIAGRFPQPLTATTTPWPTMLGGISILLKQSIAPQTVAVPILAVQQFSSCPSSRSCGVFTGISIQIPFEAAPLPTAPTAPGGAILIVSEHGNTEGIVEIFTLYDNIHTLYGACDTTARFLNKPCQWIVTHADGTLVSQSNPAKESEVLVMYAYGLGRTVPPVNTGEVTPVAAPVESGTILVGFDFKSNAEPTRVVSTDGTATRPLFAGLTPGFVGLYQINFRLPSFPARIQPCGAVILSNLTVNIAGPRSFHGAGICVEPTTGQ